MKYCVYCGVAVKLIDRGEDVKHVGKGELPAYMHVRRRSDKDPVQCHRANLFDRETTEENIWDW